VEQLISPGDAVHRGDIIAAIETQKGVIEIECFDEGVLQEWLVNLGRKVPVGTPLARIGHTAGAGDAAGSEPDEPEVPKPADPAPEPPSPEDPAPSETPPPQPGPEIPPPDSPAPEIPQPQDSSLPAAQMAAPRLRITPAARRLAARQGIDLARIAKSPDAIVHRDDVSAYAAGESGSPSDLRSGLAAAMSRSKREIPHYYLAHHVDLTNAESFLSKINDTRPPDDRYMLAGLYLKSLARAALKYPEMNGHFENGKFSPAGEVNAGLAIRLRKGGVVAPAVMNADSLDLEVLMKEMRDLVTNVRAGRFRASTFGGTITLSSLGERGVDQLYGVIYPPQVAIVGIGTPKLEPAVHDGQIVPRLMASITLAADHRVSDGHRGAQFLKAIAENLQEPDKL
ncbi:MAG: dihydrolipoamide acetyltransferase family protein, partial [Roseobacter sp.]